MPGARLQHATYAIASDATQTACQRFQAPHPRTRRFSQLPRGRQRSTHTGRPSSGSVRANERKPRTGSVKHVTLTGSSNAHNLLDLIRRNKPLRITITMVKDVYAKNKLATMSVKKHYATKSLLVA